MVGRSEGRDVVARWACSLGSLGEEGPLSLSLSSSSSLSLSSSILMGGRGLSSSLGCCAPWALVVGPAGLRVLLILSPSVPRLCREEDVVPPPRC